MKKQELDDTIRNLFKEEAANLEAPDAIKEAIDRRLADASANKETLGNIQGFPTGQGRARRGRKRVMVVLVAVFVLLFSSITGSGTANVVEIRGYSYVEPDTREFIELPELMKTAGYDFIPVEQFSNGYAFDCVHLSYAQKMDVNENPVGEPFYTMRLAYVKDGREVELSVNRVEQKFEPIPERIVETFEVNGVTIYLMKSVYFMLPENWEELITEGQRATLEGPLGNYGVFSDQETIEMQTNYAYQWEQNGYHYVLGEFLTGGEDLIEDEKVIAREWVEVN